MAAAPICLKGCEIPDVSQADITAFHDEHFSSAAVHHFSSSFFQSPTAIQDYTYDANDEHLEEDEEDNLGYYSDGVKRTLTDEQIAIFRHSELETLRREKARGTSRPAYGQSKTSLPDTDSTRRDDDGQHASASEDGELESDTPQPTLAAVKRRQNRKNKKKARKAAHKSQQNEPGWFKKNVKPDLRKRTWDKVEAGMDSLDYEDAPQPESGNNVGPATQRRKISYDD